VLTDVERVFILKAADLLTDVGPRRLLGLARVAREVEIVAGDTIYTEEDPADILYLVVEGRVRLTMADRTRSEVGPGEAFGTWSLVDGSARGHRAECTEDGLTLALHRDDFYDVAAGDLTLLQEVVRVLAKRLRALVAEHPEEARVEGEGVEKPEALARVESATVAVEPTLPISPGASLAAAALGKPPPDGTAPAPPLEAIVPEAEGEGARGPSEKPPPTR